MKPMRQELMHGVYLTYLQDRKFKTGYISAQFMMPVTVETVGMNALLAAVLRRGTARYPDMVSLSAALDQLYGARIDYSLQRKGECQCIGFTAGFIDDAYALGGEKILEPVAELVGQLICEPATKNGRFIAAYVESERTNLIDAIRSQINDKREYAYYRLLAEMCRGEAYGIAPLGEEKFVSKITVPKLYSYYQNLLADTPLELFYCGSAPLERVKRAFLDAFSALPRRNIGTVDAAPLHAPRGEMQYVEESMDVTQGKLSMGFGCTSEDMPAMVMANLLFGGSSNSKLFLNVREKLSLCYYASSAYHRSKGIITVSSGIETENYQKAFDEIMAQLKAVQQGELEDWELEGARSVALNGFRTISDSQGRIVNFYLGQLATGSPENQEDLIRAMEQVTLDRVLAAANTITPDTVYFLKGREAVQ